MSSGYWFRSTRFRIEPGEDADTNPGVFGRQLAHWLVARLREHGYPRAETVAEDWGWAVVCHRKPFCLFVACGNVLTTIDENGPKRAPDNQIVWHAYATADGPFFARLRGIDTNTAVSSLDALLSEFLRDASDIVLVHEP